MADLDDVEQAVERVESAIERKRHAKSPRKMRREYGIGAGKPKQEACEDPECYHRFPESIIFTDIQRGTVPEEALRKSCCWSKISEVRGKHRRKIGIRSATWLDLCSRMGTIR